jgi:hypothetical protein
VDPAAVVLGFTGVSSPLDILRLTLFALILGLLFFLYGNRRVRRFVTTARALGAAFATTRRTRRKRD